MTSPTARRILGDNPMMQAGPEQGEILQAIYDVFAESGRWPTVDAVDRILDERWEADAYPLLESQPPSLLAIDRLQLRPEGAVKLRVAAIARCVGSEADLGLFIAGVRWLCECERSRRPTSPHVAQQIEVKSEEFAAACAREGVIVDRVTSAKVREMISIEGLNWGGTSDIDGDPGRWTMNVNRNIRPYRRVDTVVDYLEVRARRDEEDARHPGGVPLILDDPAAATAPERADGPPYVFVAMPFGEPWSDGLHAAINIACERLVAGGAVCAIQRADEISRPGRITEQIIDAIERADVVIADIGGLNANVVYELGYAHASGATLILLSQSPGSSPFDLRDMRQIRYGVDDPAGCCEELSRHMAAALGFEDGGR
jgi:hypothetical protein